MESVWFCWGGNGGATYKSEDGADAGRCGFGVDGFAIGKTKVRFGDVEEREEELGQLRSNCGLSCNEK